MNKFELNQKLKKGNEMKTDVKPPHKLKQEQERVFYHGDGGAGSEDWGGEVNWETERLFSAFNASVGKCKGLWVASLLLQFGWQHT